MTSHPTHFNHRIKKGQRNRCNVDSQHVGLKKKNRRRRSGLWKIAQTRGAGGVQAKLLGEHYKEDDEKYNQPPVQEWGIAHLES